MTDVGSFADPTMAARLRDAMERQMISVIDSVRPPDRMGEVQTIDPDLSSCTVLFPGDTVAVPVRIGAIVPSAVGQTVRVSGFAGERYVSDVYGAALTSTPPSGDPTAVPQNFNLEPGIYLVSATWDPVDAISQYQIELADDAAFTVNARSYLTGATQFTENNLVPGEVVYARVRSVTNGGLSDPSTVDSATVQDLPLPYPSDGIPPTSSPNPVCTAGIGFILAQWVKISNVDPVTYEVHASLTSGFTADGTNKVGEVLEGDFFFIRRMPDGSTVPYNTNVFVRIIARDPDGAAGQSAQSFAASQQVNTGDAGSIAIDGLSDGAIPSSSPNAPTVTSGIGYLFVRWSQITNNDPVQYEVHVSSSSGFTPGSNTLVGTTPSDWFFIRNVGSGAGGGPLVYGTTYYVKIRAKDADGTANAGTESSGFTVQANTADIAVNSITAASGIIADAAIGTAKIQDAAITTLKVADANISTAKIQDLAVSTAKIADAAIATAKIGDLQVTSAKVSGLTADKILAGTIGAQTIILNGSTSILKSSNYVAGTSGWQIKGDGSAEFIGVTVQGTFIAGGFTIDSNGMHITPGSGFTNAITWGTDPTITNRARIYSSAGTDLTVAAGGSADLNLTASHIRCFGQLDLSTNQMIGSGGMNVTGTITFSGVKTFTGSNLTCTNLIASSVTCTTFSGGGSSISFQSGGVTINTGGALSANSVTAGAAFISMPSDTTSPLVRVNLSTNQLGVDFSSIRIKSNVVDLGAELSVDPTFMKLRPRFWSSRLHPGDLGGNDNPNLRHYGFIAEEVSAVDRRFAHDDPEGNPVAINWFAILTLLVAEVQDLRQRIHSLK